MIENKNKPKRLRSPNFPYTNLERAIELVRSLFKTFRKSPVPIDTAIASIELSPKSSKARQIMAALSAFGLIEAEGSGKNRGIKVSELGYNIIIDERPTSPERNQYLQVAALNPKIFRAIYEQFSHNIPKDELLGHELKVRHGFNPDSVADFIKVFKQTMYYAKVYEPSIMEDTISPTTTQEIGYDNTIEPTSNTSYLSFLQKPTVVDKRPTTSYGTEREIANYPVGRGLKARILVSGDTPVNIDAIEKLIKLLELNKEDLCEEDFA